MAKVKKSKEVSLTKDDFTSEPEIILRAIELCEGCRASQVAVIFDLLKRKRVYGETFPVFEKSHALNIAMRLAMQASLMVEAARREERAA